MGLNLKSYETQARFSVGLALAGGLCAVAAAVLMMQRFDAERFEIIMGSNRFLAIMGVIGLGVLVGIVGFFMGLSGAGEKRNKASQLSWTGFFLSAGVLSLTLCLLVFCYFTKNVI